MRNFPVLFRKSLGILRLSAPAFLYLITTTVLIFCFIAPYLPRSYFNALFKPLNPSIAHILTLSISEILLFIVVALTTFAFARWDQKDSAFCGVLLNPFGVRHFLYGCGLAATACFLLGVFEYCFGGFRITGWVWNAPITVAISLLAAFWVFFVSLTEELWFRGYPLQKFEDAFGWWPAAFITSLAFAACHMHNPSENYVQMAFLLLSGMILCGLRRVSGSLWLGIGAHAMADLAGIVLGAPGQDLSASSMQIVFLAVSGSDLITGGKNGLMFSLPSITMQFLLMLVPFALFSGTFRRTVSA